MTLDLHYGSLFADGDRYTVAILERSGSLLDHWEYVADYVDSYPNGQRCDTSAPPSADQQAELAPWHRRFNETFRTVLEDGDRVAFEQEASGADATRTSVTFACSTDSKHRRVCKRLPAQVTFGLVRDGAGWLIESIAGGVGPKGATP